VEEEVNTRNFVHLEIGNKYHVSGMTGVNEFVGWFTESGEEARIGVPAQQTVLLFRDSENGEQWEAYYHKGLFCWGTSADPLVVKEA